MVLEGIRVLEWAYYHVGPMAGSMLGDMGAEVIKIEDTQGGDLSRQVKMVAGIPLMTPKGSSALWDGYNRSKKSIAIDLKKPEGREIVYHLIPKFDVFLTCFRRPAVRRLGMDYETLRRYNPKLIYAHASAFGLRGPDADLPGVDYAGQARGGIMLAQRGPEEEPWTRLGLGDQMGSICTAFGILAALMARERLGVGQEVDTSITGGITWLQATLLNVTLSTGREPGPHNRQEAGNPLFNIYRAGDGKWFCLSMGFGPDAWWPAFCRAIERPELEHAPHFHDLDARNQNNRELIAILDEVFLQRTQDEWLRRFAQWDCLASPVNRLSDLAHDPQVIENEYITEYEDPVLGRQKAVGFPALLSETPMKITSAAPQYGQHTEEVLLEMGGYSWEDLARFKESGVIL